MWQEKNEAPSIKSNGFRKLKTAILGGFGCSNLSILPWIKGRFRIQGPERWARRLSWA